MNFAPCDQEPAVVAAVHSGVLSGELLSHVDSCSACAEVIFVSGLLHQIAFSADLHPPDAGLVWQRAQKTVRRKALAKATAPIRIARILASVAGLVAVPWLLSSLAAPAWLTDFGFHHLETMDRAFSEGLTGATLLSVVAALVCVSFSSWYLLRQE